MPERKPLTYKDAGVDIDLGNDASRVLYEAAKLTWNNRKDQLRNVIELSSDFSSIRGIHIGGLPAGTYFNLGFDGVGTKVELGERTLKHDTVAYDLFAMGCDDAVRYGFEPVVVGSVLDVRSLKNEESDTSSIDFIKQLAIGSVRAAGEANVVIINGEVAELGARVQGFGPFNYNWSAGVAAFAKRENIITGQKVKKGDVLVALGEEGFRSNGISLVRKILNDEYGNNWHLRSWEQEDMPLGEAVLVPSKIYTKPIIAMTGGYRNNPTVQIHAIAHITGGGDSRETWESA
ncbi:hypothetical protein HYT33_00635 [Candidatus Roizmanbacteria bacterium]|nr:hypothetical protein [Candidatus Roizmanbacteria bacterium]